MDKPLAVGVLLLTVFSWPNENFTELDENIELILFLAAVCSFAGCVDEEIELEQSVLTFKPESEISFL